MSFLRFKKKTSKNSLTEHSISEPRDFRKDPRDLAMMLAQRMNEVFSKNVNESKLAHEKAEAHRNALADHLQKIINFESNQDAILSTMKETKALPPRIQFPALNEIVKNIMALEPVCILTNLDMIFNEISKLKIEVVKLYIIFKMLDKAVEMLSLSQDANLSMCFYLIASQMIDHYQFGKNDLHFRKQYEAFILLGRQESLLDEFISEEINAKSIFWKIYFDLFNTKELSSDLTHGVGLYQKLCDHLREVYQKYPQFVFQSLMNQSLICYCYQKMIDQDAMMLKMIHIAENVANLIDAPLEQNRYLIIEEVVKNLRRFTEDNKDNQIDQMQVFKLFESLSINLKIYYQNNANKEEISIKIKNLFEQFDIYQSNERPMPLLPIANKA